MRDVQGSSARRRRTPAWPWVTAGLSGVAGALLLVPRLAGQLAYDREAIAGGQLWRLLSGHFTHWSADHLGWNVLVFAAFGAYFEAAGRRRFITCVLASALAISLVVWWGQPDLAGYRGLSGIDCALLVAVSAMAIRRTLAEGRVGLSACLAATLAAYFLKIGYEISTGGALFVDSSAAGFDVVPLAHLVGGLVGLSFVISAAAHEARRDDWAAA